jgi:hypothetical protein
MRVEAELLDHPKFIRLKSLLGPAALEVLLRIWGHCQSCHRGGHWGLVDPWYVEAVARWSGTAGECMKALRECRFIDVSPDGRVEIHDWDVMNSHMVKAWSNGKKGGRKPGQPTPPPPQTELPADPISDLLTDPRTDGLTQAEPNSEPTGRKEGRKESRKESVEGAHTPIPTQPPAFAEAPSQAEVLKAASDFQEGVGELIGHPAIHPKWAAQWWEWRGNSATRGFDTLRDWRIQLVRDWRSQARGWLARQTEAGKNAEKSPTAWEMKQRIDALEAQIRDHPGNPDNTVGSLERKKREKPACDLLKRELKELRQQLTGVGGDK